MKTFLFALIVTTCALSLSACTNTVRGVGADVEKAGQEIQKTTR
jgi:predicted small secreted protein